MGWDGDLVGGVGRLEGKGEGSEELEDCNEGCQDGKEEDP